jgi:signal transduction histidine kinase
MHRLADRRMREHRRHQLRLGALQRARNGVALDQLGHLRAHHMRAQQLPGVRVEHGLNHALRLAHREMRDMIRSILDFARDDTKHEPRSLVDLSALIEGICQDAADTGEPVTFVGPGRHDFRPFNCLATRRRQSRRQCREIWWECCRKPDPRSRARRHHCRRRGPGIPRSELEKVFEPFYRIEGFRNPDTGVSDSVSRSPVRSYWSIVETSALPLARAEV